MVKFAWEELINETVDNTRRPQQISTSSRDAIYYHLLVRAKRTKMPRPKSKEELLKLSQENFLKLIALLDSYSDKERKRDFPAGTLNRNIKDVLIHLHEWHIMFLDWYKIGMQGGKPDMPSKGYTWQTMPDLNRQIQLKNKDIAYETAKELLNSSYKSVQKVIEKHTDQELFEKKRFKWTGTTSLGTYLVSNSSSHYAWAIKLIRKSMK